MASEDRAALVALFRSTGGKIRWNRKMNWDKIADLSRWYGVKVNDDGRVVELRLPRNNLLGNIPETLGALTELTVLHLNGNSLTGPVPEALRALKELTDLNLSENKLTGPIPACLGSLGKLKNLGLGINQLAGPIPEALGALAELTELWLGYNKLTGPIPEALGALKNLEVLGLDHNELTGSIPPWLASLSKLQRLRLNDNQLRGAIPTELGNLSALSTFEVGNTGSNAVSGRGNKFTGALPTELANLSAVSTLAFDNKRYMLFSSRRKQRTEFAAMQEAVEALKSDNERQQAELEEVKSENNLLRRKVGALEKYVPEPVDGPGEDVDVAAATANHHPVTVSELRVFEALQNEKHREHEARLKELEEDMSNATNRK